MILRSLTNHMNESPYQSPETSKKLKCMICALKKPYGIFCTKTGASVCKDCRDAAREENPRRRSTKYHGKRAQELLVLIHNLVPLKERRLFRDLTTKFLHHYSSYHTRNLLESFSKKIP